MRVSAGTEPGRVALSLAAPRSGPSAAGQLLATERRQARREALTRMTGRGYGSTAGRLPCDMMSAVRRVPWSTTTAGGRVNITVRTWFAAMSPEQRDHGSRRRQATPGRQGAPVPPPVKRLTRGTPAAAAAGRCTSSCGLLWGGRAGEVGSKRRVESSQLGTAGKRACKGGGEGQRIAAGESSSAPTR